MILSRRDHAAGRSRRSEFGRLAVVLALAGLCSLAHGCKSKGDETTPGGTSLAASAAAPSLLAAGSVDPAQLVPARAMFHARVPSIAKLAAAVGLTDPFTNPALSAGWKLAAEAWSVSPDELKKLLQGFAGAAAWGSKETGVAVVARHGPGVDLAPWLARWGLSRSDAPAGSDANALAAAAALGEHSRWQTAGAKPAIVLWFGAARIVIAATSAALVDQALSVARKETPSWAAAPGYPGQAAGSLWAEVDLAGLPLGPEPTGAGSAATLEIGARFSLDVKLLGARWPRLGTVLPPAGLGLLDKLPAETVSAVELSLARASGKTLPDVVNELLRPAPDAEAALASLEAELGRRQLSLGELDAAIGDSIAFGAIMPPTATATPAPDRPFGDLGAVALLALRDDGKARKLFDFVKTEITKAVPAAKATPTSLELRSGEIGLRLALQPGVLVLTAAQPAGFDALLAAVSESKATLAERPGYAAARRQLALPAQLRMWADLPWLIEQAKQAGTMPPLGPEVANLSALALRMVMPPNPGGLHVQWQSDNLSGVALVGAMSSLAIYGVRRYLASAKTAEAKNTVGAISRGATAAYERETVDGKRALCGSAPPVPADPSAVRGKKYQPRTEEGADYETGSATAGWKCLKFSLTQPHYYQYEYVVGPGRASAIDPKRMLGANEYEAIARGDLDGDGVTSLFVRSGQLTGDQLRSSTQLYIEREFE